MDVDENGWATGRIDPLPIDHAWTLFSPEAEARIDADRWSHHAQRFFSLELKIVGRPKLYPAGSSPLADAVVLAIGPASAPQPHPQIHVVTVPIDRAAGARAAGLAAALAPYGAGFDTLVNRAKRLWQIAEAPLGTGDPRAALAAAAILASVLLAPVLPPREVAIFGVKTARERLARLGYAT